MHHINISNRRRRIFQLFFSYFVIAVTLVIFTYILVLVASGYDIDRSTGKVIQNGVLLLETEPEEANVYLNGKLEKDVTPSRFALPAGDYEVRLTLDGYRDWVSNIELSGSQVKWLYYPKMIPEEIETENIITLEKLGFFEADDSSKRLVIQQNSRPNILTVYEVNATELEPENIVIPTTLFNTNTKDSPLGKLSFVEWSSDANYMLLKYTYKTRNEFWLIDMRNPQNSSSIDDSLGVTVEDAFFGSKNSTVYVKFGGMIREYDQRSQTAPKLWATNVDSYAVEDGGIWFAKTNQGDESGIYRLGQDEDPLIDLSNDDDVLIRATNYESDSIVLVRHKNKLELYRGVNDNLDTNIVEKVIRIQSPDTKVRFSVHGRFLAVLHEDSTYIYDLETQKQYSFAVDSGSVAGWLDANRLYYSFENTLHILDFTGENNFAIASFAPRWGAHVNEEQSAIFTIGRQASTGNFILQRSTTLLEN